ncbi:MAG: hypothetical protein DRN96_03710 [Thermoproteota archaeon]|nr:MAG: hypothetical protein DRN96_03710 [Candidatus Korarchaeota archaeon]RLG54568.1 MAG: hypothetical protein DRN99_04885 [Candidatus Korarchaeota archaeon]
MKLRVFIFIRVKPGSEDSVIAEIKEKVGEHVLEASGEKVVHEITGVYDVVVYMEVESLDILRRVMESVREIGGVIDTHTAIVVK